MSTTAQRRRQHHQRVVRHATRRALRVRRHSESRSTPNGWGPRCPGLSGTHDRRGSTLLIVMVLMAMLASLGVIFFFFAASERSSAEYYSNGAKAQQFDLTVEQIMEFGMKQLVTGPDVKYKNSALYGKQHSLVGNMLGVDSSGQRFDFTPYNGVPRDGTQIANWGINTSPVANGGNDPQPSQLTNREPDYTYPDLNNVFLSYYGYEPTSGRRVIIPSFHRPQLLRASAGGAPIADWWQSSTTVNRVMRPHSRHQFVSPPGQTPPSTATLRYLDPTSMADQTAAGTAWSLPPSASLCFPLAPADEAGGTAGTLGEQGVWNVPPSNVYELDVDLNNDGIRESVYLDLDFPPQETADGRLYIPMFAFHVVELDGLLNLNAHGNLATVWNGSQQMTAPFGGNLQQPFVSRSNQGLTSGEVNPAWGLNRRPLRSGVSNHDGDYNAPVADSLFGGTDPVNWYEAANREWLHILIGRYNSSPINLFPGRYGEEHLLYKAVNPSTGQPNNPASVFFAFDGSGNQLPNPWPGPGQTAVDDNGDFQQVTGGWYGSSYTPYGMPIDFTGLGTPLFFNTMTSQYEPKVGNYGASGRARWPFFPGYGDTTGANKVTWPGTPSIPSGAQRFSLFNDPQEMVFELSDRRDEDNLFGPDELRGLHWHATDLTTFAGGNTRLTQLAPFNLNPTAAAQYTAGGPTPLEIRSRFTTLSADRKQFSLANDTVNGTRRWQFSADADGDNQLEFPPRFGGVQPYGPGDPFRPTVRWLLETEAGNTAQPRYSLRMSVNQLLVGPNGNPFPTFQPQSATLTRPQSLQLNRRPLTPHPDAASLGATAVTNFGTNSYPANGNFNGSLPLQEYWARVDRQIQARDLFVLLYTLTWPDGINPTGNGIGGTALDTSDPDVRRTIRQLAQYAVNIVDALDRDNVSTRFEYDVNLANGWGLDDNPYTTTEGGDRLEVWGAERLDLTLSEALAVRADQGMANVTFTQWDDTNTQHFCFVELRNPGPYDLSNSEAWQLEVGPNYHNPTTVPAADFNAVRRLSLRNLSVSAGEVLGIRSADNAVGSDAATASVMRVAPSGTAPMDWTADTASRIAPRTLRSTDLDLKDTAASSRFTLLDATGATVPTNALYDDIVFQKVTSSGNDLYFRLQRRANPNRPSPTNATEEADNPWILVDELVLPGGTIGASAGTTGTDPRGRVAFVSSDTSTEIQSRLSQLRSRQRAEPFGYAFDRYGYDFYGQEQYASGPGPTNPEYANSLGSDNLNSPTTGFLGWQKVYDRDFTSLGELLHINLGGFSEREELRNNSRSRSPIPGLITGIDNNAQGTWVAQSDTENNSAAVTTISPSAEQLFRPQIPNGGTGSTQAPRWFRVLEFLEVPTRMNVGIAGTLNPFDNPRVPGKLNLNMFRHPEVLAGMLDDPTVMRLAVDEDFNLDGTFNSMTEDTNANSTFDVFRTARLWRQDLVSSAGTPTPEGLFDWWQGFLRARDGLRNPTTGAITPDPTTGLYLPGVAGSVPFRSFGNVGGSGEFNPVEATVLRSWPTDLIPVNDSDPNKNPRQLFELGTRDEKFGTDAGGGTLQPLDPLIRSRLTNKALNHGTTRSNTFAVFVGVQYFRALDAGGAVRIGGPLNGTMGSPEHRAFYVIDRSQLEKAYDVGTGTFNWRGLVQFSQILQ